MMAAGKVLKLIMALVTLKLDKLLPQFKQLEKELCIGVQVTFALKELT